jgi:hypothetical protein
VQQRCGVESPDIRATQVLYPTAQKAMAIRNPNRQSLLYSQEALQFLGALRRGVRREEYTKLDTYFNDDSETGRFRGISVGGNDMVKPFVCGVARTFPRLGSDGGCRRPAHAAAGRNGPHLFHVVCDLKLAARMQTPARVVTSILPRSSSDLRQGGTGTWLGHVLPGDRERARFFRPGLISGAL